MEAVYAELALIALAAMLSPTTLSFSILALVLGERPKSTGFWFFLGAFSVTLIIGVIAAFVLGNAAASPKPNTPKTSVAIIDIVAGVLALVVIVRLLRKPVDPAQVEGMIQKMSKVASSPVVAIVAAGASLANPGAFIPLALKSISETNPSAGEYILLWLGFAVISLLPLLLSLVMLLVAPERALRMLHGARAWLERNAIRVAAAILFLLAISLIRNGIAGLTS